MTVLDYDEDDRDAPLAQDIDDADADDDHDNVTPCPSCGRDVYEDAEKCPSCGDWIVSAHVGTGLHWVWLIAAVMALTAMFVIVIY